MKGYLPENTFSGLRKWHKPETAAWTSPKAQSSSWPGWRLRKGVFFFFSFWHYSQTPLIFEIELLGKLSAYVPPQSPTHIVHTHSVGLYLTQAGEQESDVGVMWRNAQ